MRTPRAFPRNEVEPKTALAVFMLAHFSHHVCTSAMVPLLPMIRDDFQLDYLRSGLLLSAFGMTYGFMQLPMGAISDRLGQKLVVALGLLSTGIACIFVGFSGSYLQVLLSLLLLGLAGSTYHAPSTALLSQLFSKETRGRFLGIHISAGTAGLMAAPIIGFFVINLTGSWRYAFFSMGVPILLAGVLMLAMPGIEARAQSGAAARERVEPLPILQVVRLLGSMVVIGILTQLLVAGMNSYLPIFMVDKHGIPQDHAALVMALVYGTGVVGVPIGGILSDRIGRMPVILISVVGAGPLIALVTVLPFGAAMILAIAAYGFVQSFRLATIESHFADVVPVRQRATALGAYNLLSQQTTGITTPMLGWLMDQFGLNGGYGLLAGAALGSSLLVLVLRKKILGRSPGLRTQD